MLAKNRLCIFVSLNFLFLSGSQLIGEENNETIIEDTTLSRPDSKFTYVKDSTADQSPSDSTVLYNIPGLSLIESGGHLGASEISYRGLTNSRIKIDFENLSLNNPTTGQIDANSMFLFAASKVQSDASSLSIFLPKISVPQAKGIFGFGSQNSLKLGASAGTPLNKTSSIFVATQLTSTNGKFTFSSADKKSNLTRENNDQHRLQALANYKSENPNGKSHALIAVNAHEGGIAGFAASPTPNLRCQAIFSGLSMGFTKKVKSTNFSVNLSNSVFDYRTTDIPNKIDSSISSTHELTLGMENLALPKWMQLELGQQLVIERAYKNDQTRVGGGILLSRTSTINGKLKPKITSNFSMIGYKQFGLLFKKDLGISIEPFDYLNINARFVRSQRLPTFMEIYAQNDFFVGNQDLNKESIWDIELGTNIRLGQIAHLKITGFMGYLSDAIVTVPFLGTKSRPINITTASRHGVDLGFSIEPLSWLKFDTTNSILRTKIKSTGAPLPKAPPFLGLTKIRFGEDDILALTLQSRYRGSSSANIYGTLRSDAYALFDTILASSAIKHVGLSLLVSNILNNKNARDTYEMPLPATTFFAQIEIGNI